MINWINFLHIYQPPLQEETIFHKVARESYFEIVKFFDLYDNLNLTMNISGSLLEQLVFYQYDKLLEDFKRAFLAGEMELTGSAMYHPILPLLPESEIERQILLDEKMKKQIFGSSYERRGFYLPEMAYSKKVAQVLEKMGFEWIILDEISCCGAVDVCDTGKVYKIRDMNLKVVFRSRVISDAFVPEKIIALSAECKEGESNIVTATDGELYGHRHHDFYDKTRRAVEDGNVKAWKVSDFIKSFDGVSLEEVEPVSSCWESREEDIKADIPFPYWSDPENEIQKELWSFADFVCTAVETSQQDANYKVARDFADRGLSSCHFWAASGKESFVWKDVIWNPDTIERGNLFFIKAIRSLCVADISLRMEAEKKFLKITESVWACHWNRFYKS